jgi:hypothetical protein
MAGKDVLQVEILPDGTLKTTTDPISPANHQSAEEFLRGVTELAGGEATRTRKQGKTQHVHHHHGQGGHKH